jgi:hypothetical protein
MDSQSTARKLWNPASTDRSWTAQANNRKVHLVNCNAETNCPSQDPSAPSEPMIRGSVWRPGHSSAARRSAHIFGRPGTEQSVNQLSNYFFRKMVLHACFKHCSGAIIFHYLILLILVRYGIIKQPLEDSRCLIATLNVVRNIVSLRYCL